MLLRCTEYVAYSLLLQPTKTSETALLIITSTPATLPPRGVFWIGVTLKDKTSPEPHSINQTGQCVKVLGLSGWGNGNWVPTQLHTYELVCTMLVVSWHELFIKITRNPHHLSPLNTTHPWDVFRFGWWYLRKKVDSQAGNSFVLLRTSNGAHLCLGVGLLLLRLPALVIMSNLTSVLNEPVIDRNRFPKVFGERVLNDWATRLYSMVAAHSFGDLVASLNSIIPIGALSYIIRRLLIVTHLSTSCLCIWPIIFRSSPSFFNKGAWEWDKLGREKSTKNSKHY